jgi:hypothetical protein
MQYWDQRWHPPMSQTFVHSVAQRGQFVKCNLVPGLRPPKESEAPRLQKCYDHNKIPLGGFLCSPVGYSEVCRLRPTQHVVVALIRVSPDGRKSSRSEATWSRPIADTSSP